MNDLNPYQPPAAHEEETAGSFEDFVQIDGAVTVEDIAELAHKNWLVSFMKVVTMATALVILAVPMLLGTLTSVTSIRLSFWFFPFLGVAIALASLFAFLTSMLSAKAHARRLVKRNPNCVGPILGRLDDFGLTVYNEENDEYQQYSWAAFPITHVTSAGVRLDWQTADASYFAIPASAIAGFDKNKVRAIIDRFFERATEPAVHMVRPEWNDAPAGAVHFYAYSSPKPPPKRRDYWLHRAAIFSVYILGPVLLLMIVGGEYRGNDWLRLLTCILSGVVMAAAIGSQYLRVRIELAPFLTRHWGWANADRIFVRSPGLTVDSTWEDSTRSELDHGDIIVVASKCAILVSQENVIQGEWHEWKEWSSQAKKPNDASSI